MLNRKLPVLLLLVFLVIVLSACGSSSFFRGLGSGNSNLVEKNIGGPRTRLPWEVYSFGSTPTGQKLTSPAILKGDEAIEQSGDRKRALVFYKTALGEKLQADEREAVIERIAATELSLDKPENAIKTLSDYFRFENKTEAQVSPRMAIIFAYAYGRKNNTAQSFAWFSKARRDSGLPATASGAARSGVLFVARNVPTEDLSDLSVKWISDDFIRNAIAEEKARRGSRAYDPSLNSYQLAYNSLKEQPTNLVDNSDAKGRGIVFALELTGNFKSLGEATKRGVETAARGAGLDAPDGGDQLSIKFIDAVGNKNAVSDAEENSPAVIVGPLLHVAAATFESEVSGAPLVSLAKNSEAGNTALHFAPSTKGQVINLFDKVTALGFKKFAIVGSDAPAFTEYAEIAREEILNRGGQLVFEQMYKKGDETAMIEIGKLLEQQSIDAIFYADDAKAARVFFGNLSDEERSLFTILGPASWVDKDVLRASGVLNKAIWPIPYFQGGQVPAIQAFNDSYKGTYGVVPDYLSAQGFDLATMLISAVKTRISQGGGLLETLVALGPYDGLTGVCAFRPDGSVERQFRIVQLREGKIEEMVR